MADRFSSTLQAPPDEAAGEPLRESPPRKFARKIDCTAKGDPASAEPRPLDPSLRRESAQHARGQVLP